MNQAIVYTCVSMCAQTARSKTCRNEKYKCEYFFKQRFSGNPAPLIYTSKVLVFPMVEQRKTGVTEESILKRSSCKMKWSFMRKGNQLLVLKNSNVTSLYLFSRQKDSYSL